MTPSPPGSVNEAGRFRASYWVTTAPSTGSFSSAPIHTFVAWAFAAFIVMHIYLTTTGETPLSGIKSMITGWEDVEVHGKQTNESDKETANV